MVIGSGLIANALKEYENDDTVIVFASGVSNSMGNDESAFEREKNLLLSFKDHKGKLIYFSTCSIYDASLSNSSYVKHKLEMEKLIQENFKKYFILRLPTLVGNTVNSHTFFNNFKDKLKNNEEIIIHKNASRYLMDVESLPAIIKLMLNTHDKNAIVNIAFDNKASVSDIVSYMRTKLRSNSNMTIVDKGADLLIDNSDFLNMLSNYPQFDVLCVKTMQDVLNKYLSE